MGTNPGAQRGLNRAHEELSSQLPPRKILLRDADPTITAAASKMPALRSLLAALPLAIERNQKFTAELNEGVIFLRFQGGEAPQVLLGSQVREVLGVTVVRGEIRLQLRPNTGFKEVRCSGTSQEISSYSHTHVSPPTFHRQEETIGESGGSFRRSGE